MPENTLPTTTTPISEIQKITEGITNIPDATANAITEKIIAYLEHLMNQTMEMFNEFLSKGEATHNNQDNLLHILMMRYNIEKSRISELAEGYGKMAWYKRYAIGITFVAASALVGAIFNLAAVFSILAISIFYITTSLLSEHDDITSKRDERFCEDIINMEKKLTESNEVLVNVANKVNGILVELSTKMAQSTDNITLFEDNILTLNNQIHHLLKTTQELEQTKNSLIRENEKITSQFQHACAEVEKEHLDMQAQSTALNAVTNKLDKTDHALLTQHHELTSICEKLQRNLTAIAKHESDFQDQIKIVKTRVASGEVSHTNPSESEQETMELKINTDRILAESDKLLAKINLHREEDANEEQSEEISTAVLLARVTAQMEALENKKSPPNFRPQ